MPVSRAEVSYLEEPFSVKLVDAKCLSPKPLTSYTTNASLRSSSTIMPTSRISASYLSSLHSTFFCDDQATGSSYSNDSNTSPEAFWCHSSTSSSTGVPRTLHLEHGSLIAVYYANTLQIYSMENSTRKYEYVFEEDGQQWPITCLVECRFPNLVSDYGLELRPNYTHQISPYTILVSVMKNESVGYIYLIDYITATILINIEIPFIPTALLPTWIPDHPVSLPTHYSRKFSHGILKKFAYPLVIGTRGGRLFVLDMYFDQHNRDIEKSERSCEEVFDSLMDFNPLEWLTNHHDIPTHPFFDLTDGFSDSDSLRSGYFDYLNPQHGELLGTLDNIVKLPAAGISITSLHLIVPRTKGKKEKINRLGAMIVVGYNFGAFQLWLLNTMALVYCSPLNEVKASVTHFAHQHLIQADPKIGANLDNSILLWVCRGSVASTHTNQLHGPHISAYRIDISVLDESDSFKNILVVDSLQHEYSRSLLPSNKPHDFGRFIQVEPIAYHVNPDESRRSIFFLWEIFPHPNNFKNNSGRVEYSLFSLDDFKSPIEAVKVFSTNKNKKTMIQSNPLNILNLTYQNTPVLGFSIQKATIQHHCISRTKALDLDLLQLDQSLGDSISFEALCSNEESILRISFNSIHQLLSQVISEQASTVFEQPDSIAPLIRRSGFSFLPCTQRHTALNNLSLELLFTLALYYNLTYVISDYILQKRVSIFSSPIPLQSDFDGHQNLEISNQCAANTSIPPTYLFVNPISVLNWAWNAFKNIEQKVSTRIAAFFNQSESKRSIQIAYFYRAEHLINDLYNIFNALLVRYQNQANATSQGEAALQEKINMILNASVYIEIWTWITERSINQEYANVDYRQKLVQSCAKRRSLHTIRYNASPLNIGLENDALVRASSADRPIRESSRLQVDYMLEYLRSLDDHPETLDHDSTSSTSVQSNTHVYPPASFQSLINSYRENDLISSAQCYQTLLYFLLDLAHFMPSVVDQRMPSHFSDALFLPLVNQRLVRGLWCLDMQKYQDASIYLSDLAVIEIIDVNLAFNIMRDFYDGGAAREALEFLRLVNFPKDHLNAYLIRMLVLLANNLVSDAFNFLQDMNQIMESSLSSPSMANNTSDASIFSPCMNKLFYHFYDYCFKNNLMQWLFKLPLNELHVNYLKSYLCSLSVHAWENHHAPDLLLIYYLQQHKYIEAIKLYNSMTNNYVETMVMNCDDHDNTYQQKNEINKQKMSMCSALVNAYRSMLPQVVQDQFFLRSDDASSNTTSSLTVSDNYAKVTNPIAGLNTELGQARINTPMGVSGLSDILRRPIPTQQTGSSHIYSDSGLTRISIHPLVQTEATDNHDKKDINFASTSMTPLTAKYLKIKTPTSLGQVLLSASKKISSPSLVPTHSTPISLSPFGSRNSTPSKIPPIVSSDSNIYFAAPYSEGQLSTSVTESYPELTRASSERIQDASSKANFTTGPWITTTSSSTSNYDLVKSDTPRSRVVTSVFHDSLDYASPQASVSTPTQRVIDNVLHKTEAINSKARSLNQVIDLSNQDHNMDSDDDQESAIALSDDYQSEKSFFDDLSSIDDRDPVDLDSDIGHTSTNSQPSNLFGLDTSISEELDENENMDQESNTEGLEQNNDQVNDNLEDLTQEQRSINLPSHSQQASRSLSSRGTSSTSKSKKSMKLVSKATDSTMSVPSDIVTSSNIGMKNRTRLASAKKLVPNNSNMTSLWLASQNLRALSSDIKQKRHDQLAPISSKTENGKRSHREGKTVKTRSRSHHGTSQSFGLPSNKEQESDEDSNSSISAPSSPPHTGDQFLDSHSYNSGYVTDKNYITREDDSQFAHISPNSQELFSLDPSIITDDSSVNNSDSDASSVDSSTIGHHARRSSRLQGATRVASREHTRRHSRHFQPQLQPTTTEDLSESETSSSISSSRSSTVRLNHPMALRNRLARRQAASTTKPPA